MQKMAGKRVFGETVHEKKHFQDRIEKQRANTVNNRTNEEKKKAGKTMATTQEKRADEIKK